jgi:hypothetical protein
MGNEREKFSQRLAHAMRQAGYEPRPTVLFHLFNTHYRGRSVSVQTTSRWLGAQAIPAQDKLQVLADLLGVEPHALRFGSTPRSRRERQTIDAYLQLPPKKRELVGELVKALSDGT